MTLDTIIILAVLAILLVVLLLRRGNDEAFGRLQGTIQAEVQRGTSEIGEKIANFTIDQAKSANAGQAETRVVLEAQKSSLSQQVVGLQLALADGVAALRTSLYEAEAREQKTQGEQREALVEQIAALKRDLAQGLGDQRNTLAEAETRQQKMLTDQMTVARDLIERKSDEQRTALEAKVKEMREANDARLADIQKSVNEQLATAVEKQMTESFARVIDQFNAIQAMMGNVSAVASQVGDLKRLFGNVKTRGGWGETQVKALLDDILPAGSYETNVKLRDDSADAVEFAILMPTTGEQRVFLAVDAKFPVEDYERLMNAWDAADPVAEAQARRGLETRVRGEAAKIGSKYICPPRTVEFGVMYLPTEGLYAEIARIPGLIDDIGRTHRVLVLGPSLLPAMLRTIQLGHVTLALSKNAEGVRELLSATKAEMGKMDAVLTSLGKQVGTVSNTIGRAQTRTRAISRKLRGVEAMPGDQAEVLLEIEIEVDLDAEP
ncbi:MAG: RmuC family protein [Rhodospirillales bacterium]|jgi:DNA recombination protein RmuC|nr:RmuC family protein [Rhodospirillales bacterium]MDB5384044.1 RmuC family protein [Rhodospirillales bacterium]